MLRMVARESAIAVHQAPQIAATSASRRPTSIATSVPVPERDADVGRRQGGGVVDPVADHRDGRAARLEAADWRHLAVRTHVGHDALDPDRRAIASAVASVVTRQHRHVEPDATQAGDGLAPRPLWRVGDRRERPPAGRRRPRTPSSCRLR